MAEVGRALEESGLEPGCLELEITESAAMTDAPATMRALRALRKLGVRLAIDDFGTGYSSLGRLHWLPFDTLKVDGSFVGRLGRGAGSTAIVRAVTTLAHDLGLEVTAEWVETPEQAAQLLELGVDRAQGFHFAPPLGGKAVAELLARTDRLPEGHGAADGAMAAVLDSAVG